MIKITVLVENSAGEQSLLSEHGLSFRIEDGKHKILFDTGQSDILLDNARVLGIDLKDTEAVVLSHGHYDHTGGLYKVLETAPAAKVYLHPEALKPKYVCRGPDSGHDIGMPARTVQMVHRRESSSVIHTDKPTEVFPGITVTGPVKRVTDFEQVSGPFFLDAEGKKPDLLIDDQSLFFESAGGIVVVLGCAHAGVVNTLQYISELSGAKEFYAVMGGMHLGNATDERITKTVEALRGFKVARIGPCHCTGEEAVRKISRAFPDGFFECSTGVHIEFKK